MKNIEFPDFDELSPLKTFPSEAFISKDIEEQKVCDFILALAVFYNDFKDVDYAWYYFQISAPKTPKIETYYGQHVGMRYHVFKIYISLFLEMFKLIKKSKKTIELPLFKKIENKLPKKAKMGWNDIKDISKGKQAKDKELNSFLKKTRNRVASHYDVSEISKGYKRFFKKNKMDAFVSLGNCLLSTRFYYADAAVEGYIEHCLDSNKAETFKKINTLNKKVSNTIYYILVNFVKARGFAYRNYVPKI